MTQPRDPTMDVLKRLLSEAEAESAIMEADHLDDELLALLAEGALQGAERDRAIKHLAQCAHCRRVASLLMADAEEPTAHVTILRPTTWHSRPIIAWATAAALLVAAAGVFFSQRAALHREQEKAARIAVNENRVAPQKKQPPQQDEILQSPKPERSSAEGMANSTSPGKTGDGLAGTIALASAGRLTDYGFALDGEGVAMRAWSPGPFKSLEALPEGNDLTSLLNRGQLLLKAGQPARAVESFGKATQRFPQSAFAWLGLGLGHYADQDLDAAASDFRKALELDSKSQAARVNLAMTLEKQKDRAAALQVWRSLLQEDLSAEDRAMATQRVRVLEAGQTK